MFARDYYDIGVNLLVLLLMLPPLLLPPSVPKRHPIDAPNHSACPASLSFQLQNFYVQQNHKTVHDPFRTLSNSIRPTYSLPLVSVFK